VIHQGTNEFARTCRSVTSLAEVEQSVLPQMLQIFDASLAVFYLFSQGPLEILHSGGWPRLEEELLQFHQTEAGIDWLTRSSRSGPVLRNRCNFTDSELVSSPLYGVLADANTGHSRGLVLNARGAPLGLITLIRAPDDLSFEAHHDDTLLTLASPLSDLMERLINQRRGPATTLGRAMAAIDEGVAFFDRRQHLCYANPNGWRHLGQACRREGSWLTLPQALRVEIRRCHALGLEADSGPSAVDTIQILLPTEHEQELRAKLVPCTPEGERGEVCALITAPLSLLPLASAENLSDALRLTRRERQVCQHLVDGKSNRDISSALGITEHTTKIHVRRVLGKLSIRRRSEVPGAVLKALSTSARPGGHATRA
jgi:DNA-binding CsgD family transcriptional regulator